MKKSEQKKKKRLKKIRNSSTQDRGCVRKGDKGLIFTLVGSWRIRGTGRGGKGKKKFRQGV